MFKLSQEFTFSISSNDTVTNFVAQLVFKSNKLNEFGTLHTTVEMENFNHLLNNSLSIPEHWTLETLAQTIFYYASSLFSNLDAVNVSLKEFPERVAEYKSNENVSLDNVLELNTVA